MVSVVVIEFSGMRCQPLRRALGTGWKIGTTTVKSAPS
ncbi:TPA: iron transporter [Vibrio cholerae]|nr:iron transporter [Vibrio cholerae]HEQ3615774.1 iron transporter [Vibrio cholerae]